jgi:uncharacterized protein involved in outer membrane biogenesis/flagellar motor protein MotB
MLKKIRTLRLWQKFLLSAVTIYILYILFGFFILPHIIKNALEGPVAKQLYRDVSIKEVSFNPFTLECTIKGMKVFKEGHKTHLLDLDTILINLEASSLFKRALIVKQFVLKGPDIRITRYKDGSFSFSDALAKMQKIEKKRVEEENKEPFRFSINNISLVDGRFHFYDELEGSEHEIKEITLAIPFISNLKTKVHIFTTPKFSAVIDGSRFETAARTQPFSPTRPGEAKIKFTDLDLKQYFPYIDQLVAGKLEKGSLSADATVDFRLSDQGEPIINLYGKFHLKDLAFLDPDSRKVFSIKAVTIDINESDIVSSFFELNEIAIKGPYLMVERLGDGSINLAGLLKSEKKAGKDDKADRESEKGAASKANGHVGAHVVLKRLALEGGRIDFKDSANPIPFETSLKALNIELRDVDNQGKSPAKWRIGCTLLKDAELDSAGEVWLTNGSLAGVVELDGISIPLLSAYYSPYINGTIERGEFDLDSLLFEVSSRDAGGPAVLLKDIDLSVEGLAIKDRTGKRVINIAETGLEGALVDLERQVVNTGRFYLNDGAISLEIGKDGSINLTSLVPPSSAKAPDPQGQDGADSSGHSPETGSWTVEIPEASISKSDISIRDNSAPKPADIKISDLGLTIKEISTRRGDSGPITLAATLNKNGRIKLNGTASITPAALAGRLTAYSIPLSSFQAYIPPEIRLVIAKGAAWASSDIEFSMADDGKIALKSTSDIEIKGFKALERGVGKRFVAWKNFSVKGLKVAYAPFAIKVRSVVLDRPYTLIELDKEKNLNLNRIFPVSPTQDKADTGTQGGETKETAQKAKDASLRAERERKKGGEIPDLFVDEILVKDGIIEVADYSVEPFFHTELSNFTCKITGLNSLKDKPAQIKAEGYLPGNAMLRISGEFNPFAQDIYADLDVSLNNIGLTRFTPYTGKYLGYTLKKGKASVDVQLKLEKREVDLMDRIFVDQLDFGQPVESKEATSLPVKLAVALLKDRNGQIKLNIPVSGSLDDPDFSIASALFSVIGNLIAKAATSPFSILSAAFGSSEEINIIPFAPGSAELNQEARKRLDTLAKILTDRPELKIELLGNASSDKDRQALHEQKFWRLIKAQKFEDLSSKEKERITIDELVITDEEYPDYLEDAYKAAPFDKPKNFIGMVKSQPVEVMEKMLREHIKITDHDLRDLANRRAQKVAEYLVGKAGVGPERIFVLEYGSRALELPPDEPREVVEIFVK